MRQNEFGNRVIVLDELCFGNIFPDHSSYVMHRYFTITHFYRFLLLDFYCDPNAFQLLSSFVLLEFALFVCFFAVFSSSTFPSSSSTPHFFGRTLALREQPGLPFYQNGNPGRLRACECARALRQRSKFKIGNQFWFYPMYSSAFGIQHIIYKWRFFYFEFFNLRKMSGISFPCNLRQTGLSIPVCRCYTRQTIMNERLWIFLTLPNRQLRTPVFCEWEFSTLYIRDYLQCRCCLSLCYNTFKMHIYHLII